MTFKTVYVCSINCPDTDATLINIVFDGAVEPSAEDVANLAVETVAIPRETLLEEFTINIVPHYVYEFEADE